MSVTTIDPRVHWIRDTPVARFFRRILRCEDFITFFFAPTGQWILAYWIDRGHHVVEEVDDLGGTFERVTPGFVGMVLAGWGRRTNWSSVKRQVLASQAENAARAEADIVESGDRWEWLKKRTNRDIPYLFKL